MQDRNLTRRGFLRLSSMGAAGVMLAACTVPAAPGQAPAVEGEEASAAPASDVTSVRFASDWVEGVRGESMTTALELFAEENPTIHIELEPIGGDYFDRLQIQFAGGTVADVILFEGTLGAEYMQEGLIAEITDTLNALEVDLTQWRPGVPDVFRPEGKIYATPFQLTPGAWYVNKTLFAEKGVPLPEPTWGWDDILEAAIQLTSAPDTYGLWVKGHLFVEIAAMGLANGDIHWVDEDLTHTNFGEPEFADGIRWTIEALQTHKVSPLPGEVAGLLTTGISNLFATGKIGMAPLNSGAVGTFRRDIGDRFEWDVMPTPVAPRTGQTGGMWNDQPHVVTNNAVARGVVGEATRLTVHLSGPAMQELIAASRGSTPTVRSVQESDAYLSPPPEGMSNIVNELDLREGPRFFPRFLEWFQTANKELELGLIGERGIDETIEAMVTECDKVLASL